MISNANDALEKLRLTSLTDKQVLGGAEHLNISIKAIPDNHGIAQLVITGMFVYIVWDPRHSCVYDLIDTGIGMTPEELTKNLVRSSLCC